MIYFLLYLAIALFLASLLAGWLYYFPLKKVHFLNNFKTSAFLFFLRLLSILAILMLLFNPTISRKVITTHKPQLIVAIDNSASIVNMGAAKDVKESWDIIKEKLNVSNKFEVQYLSFGSETSLLDTLNFTATETNFSNLFSHIKKDKLHQIQPIILLTDGNQTQGNDYTFIKSKNPVFPIVFGDTTQILDVSISQLNANRYTFLENEFPVEVFVQYTGKKAVQTEFSVFENKQRIFSKKIALDAQRNFEVVSFLHKTNQKGTHFYTVSLNPLPEEKNIQNNRKDFSIEVVDQQQKILLLSSFIHPDLGVIKQSIESNKQRTVDLSLAGSKELNINDYQLIIFYQPSRDMQNIFKDAAAKNKNYLIITGKNTDWNFLNAVQPHFNKKFTQMKEQYQGVLNLNYPNFSLPDFLMENLPPLQDVFGEITFTTPYETVLFQKVSNTVLETPLLATFDRNETKYSVLFGEGLWQWKMFSKKETQSDDPFYSFFNAIVQYTVAGQKAERLVLNYEKLLFKNQTQEIIVQFYDQNFKLDTRANLTVQLTNENQNTTSKQPMVLRGNEYSLSLNDLQFGDYNFSITVDHADIKSFGRFRVLDYSVEEQFVTADYHKLNLLASNTGGKIYVKNQTEALMDELLNDDYYKNVQKMEKKVTSLINWKWLLAIIILSLSVEWFIRKYRGLI